VSQENVEIVERLWAAFSGDVLPLIRDDERWGALANQFEPVIDPELEIVTRERPDGDLTFKGLGGFRSVWLEWLAPYEVYRLKHEEAIDCGERVLAVTRNFGRMHGSEHEVEHLFTNVLTLHNGKLTRWEPYFDRARALKAVGLEA
jgi:hypothetical protein